MTTEVCVFENAAVVAREAAKRMAAVLSPLEAPRLAISGGSALKVLPELFPLLAGRWERVRLTFTDERCVPLASRESNRGAWLALQPPLVPHTLPLFLDEETPAQAAARAAELLRQGFGGSLDVALLGLGEDGHIASLFHREDLPELVVPVFNSPKPPAQRVTVTRRVLEATRLNLVFALGEGKRSALTRLLAGESSLPAQGLPGLVIYTDIVL